MPVQPRRAYQSDSATATVRLSGVGFGYAAAHRTLQGVNLILPAGSFHFLTGPSGAGKSTLLKLLTLAEHPQTGTLHLFGEDATMVPRRALPALKKCSLSINPRNDPWVNHDSSSYSMYSAVSIDGAMKTSVGSRS